jgi:hypothetical protein
MVGFDAKNKNTINPLYICRPCTFILREPFQLGCGHRQCKTCIDDIEGYIRTTFEQKLNDFFLKGYNQMCRMSRRIIEKRS